MGDGRREMEMGVLSSEVLGFRIWLGCARGSVHSDGKYGVDGKDTMDWESDVFREPWFV
jgi:hypothetical protein